MKVAARKLAMNMKTLTLVAIVVLASVAGPTLLCAATLSISKDVRFTAGTPQNLSQDIGSGRYSSPGPARDIHIMRTRDGGTLLTGFGPESAGSYPALFVRRIDSFGGTVWTRRLGDTNAIHMLYDVTENEADEIIVLTASTINEFFRSQATPRIVKLSQSGDILQEQTPVGDPTGQRQYFFSRILPTSGGYILAGKSQEQRGCPPCWSIVTRRVALDFSVEWETRVLSSVYTRPDADNEWDVLHLERTHSGGFIYVLSRGLVIKARADGTSEWVRGYGNWCVNAPCYENPVRVHPLRDGGYALLYSSVHDAISTAYRTAPNYGMSDYWIVRINASGQQLWDRSYGGNLQEAARFLIETEDGGFMVGGASASDNISGNKGVVGMGTWCLKLDSGGVKEAELLLPGDYWTILPKASGFSLVGWGTNSSANLVSADLNALRRASVTARAVDGRPFNLDVSTNLVDWTPLMIGFTGELNLLQTYNGDRKFYRAVEP